MKMFLSFHITFLLSTLRKINATCSYFVEWDLFLSGIGQIVVLFCINLCSVLPEGASNQCGITVGMYL